MRNVPIVKHLLQELVHGDGVLANGSLAQRCTEVLEEDVDASVEELKDKERRDCRVVL